MGKDFKRPERGSVEKTVSYGLFNYKEKIKPGVSRF
jgi:hypothetical protein